MKEKSKPQLKFFYYKEAITFSLKKKKKCKSKTLPKPIKKEFLKKEWKKMHIKVSFKVKYILVWKKLQTSKTIKN